MLSIMRKNASSLLIKFIFVIIVIVFVFWGVGSFQESKANRVARVNGDTVTVDDYKYAYDNYVKTLEQQYGQKLDQDFLKKYQVSKQVINSLITQKLLLQQAEKMDIRVTDTELASAIQSISAFQDGGTFNSRRYTYVLERNDLTPESFEASQREAMVVDKLTALVTSGIKVTEGEILDWYDWINESVNIDYVLFDPNTIQNIEPTKDELDAFFDSNKENYRTEPKVRVRYMAFRPEQYEDKVQISDADVQNYYNENISEFKKEKTVEARHILIAVPENASPEVVEEKKKKAEEILKMAQEGQDFAELAKKYSDGATKETGGLLGEFKKGDMVAPFSEAAFSMKPGEIRGPVRTVYGWHIIKVEKVHEASVSPLEKVSGDIRKKLTKNAAKELAHEAADDAFQKAFNEEDFEKTASELGIEPQSTDFFTAAGPDDGISDPKAFADAAFNLPGTEISDVLNIGDNYYILQKTGEKPSEIPALADVESTVRADLVRKMQDDQARKEAEEFLAAAKTAKGLEAPSKQKGVEIHSSGFFKRSGTIPDIGYESEIIQAAFSLSDENKLADAVFKGSKGYYVIQFKERKAPEKDELETQKDTIKSRLASQKREIIFNSWLNKIRSESEITINEDYLD